MVIPIWPLLALSVLLALRPRFTWAAALGDGALLLASMGASASIIAYVTTQPFHRALVAAGTRLAPASSLARQLAQGTGPRDAYVVIALGMALFNGMIYVGLQLMNHLAVSYDQGSAAGLSVALFIAVGILGVFSVVLMGEQRE
jgi:hypothetical protein